MDTLGIDISKLDFAACLLSDRGEARKAFPNNATGYKQLDAWLRNRKVSRVHACMEATSSFWEPLALHLHGQGHRVSVVNPARTKAFAQSELLRAKTDDVDAAMIARFARSHELPAWEPLAPEIRDLQAFVRHLEHLKATRAQQLVRLQTPGLPKAIVRSIRELIAALDAQIALVERETNDHYDQHPELKKRRNLLVSIPGIGKTTADLIVAEMPRIERFRSGKEVAAYAGLSPRTMRSGTSIRGKGRMCKTGNARLRRGLYLPALTAQRYNSRFTAFAQRLRDAGKHPMVILGAIMRKLLVVAYGVLKSGTPYAQIPAAA